MAGKKKKPSYRVSFKLDGVAYSCDLGAIANVDELDLYNDSGLTIGGLRNVFARGGGFPPFAMAAVMFLARRQAGDKTANYRVLLDSIDRYDAVLEFGEESEADDRPEA